MKMVNNMENNLEALFQSGDIESICKQLNLYDFQVKMILALYNKIKDVDNLKNNLFERINSGYYHSDEQINFMASSYIENCILHTSDNGYELLTTKCGLEDLDAKSVIGCVLRSNKSLNEMLSDELDVSNINIRVNDMMSALVPIFISSYNENKQIK